MTGHGAETSTPPGPGRGDRGGWPIWAKAVLIASLALNVAVIGVVAGYQIRDRENRVAGNRQVDWIVRMAPESRRDFTLAHFAHALDELQTSQVERFAQMDQIMSALRAEPFEPAQLSAALKARRDGTLARRLMVHEHLVTLMIAFTPDERRIFADNLAERISSWKARRDPGLSSAAN